MGRRDGSLAINDCGGCGETRATVGEQGADGERYCRTCLQETPHWLALTNPLRNRLIAYLDALDGAATVRHLREATPDLTIPTIRRRR